MTTVLTPVAAVPARPASGAGAGAGRRVWAWAWPKLLAVGLVLALWQIVVWSGWRPEYVLPGPVAVLGTLADLLGTGRFWQAIATTLLRALAGFALALVVGSVIGVLVAGIRPLRLAMGALLTGLQTMPSIAWFPLAILLFGMNEQAILFVVVLGAAPSIANGVISGIDHVPPAFTRLGRVLGAGAVAQYRFITLPAALPSYVAGLTQGWAFAWRSLMAGELLVIIATRPSLGANLEYARQFSEADRLLATMLVVLVIGMLVDGVFAAGSRRLRHRWGLTAA